LIVSTDVVRLGAVPLCPILQDTQHFVLVRSSLFCRQLKGGRHGFVASDLLGQISNFILKGLREGRGSGKAAVFTESITTQEYLRRLLLDIGLSDEDVTLFRCLLLFSWPAKRLRLGAWSRQERARLF
jgi:hypothetical protein